MSNPQTRSDAILAKLWRGAYHEESRPILAAFGLEIFRRYLLDVLAARVAAESPP
jgi:hypothetical protein